MAGVSIRIEFLIRQTSLWQPLFCHRGYFGFYLPSNKNRPPPKIRTNSSKNVIMPTTPALHIDIFANSGVVLTPT